jgi:hypothetical protein
MVLVASFLLAIGYGTMAQNIPSVPDPMQGINPMPLAHGFSYPNIPTPPLPPGVRDPVASIMPKIPVVIPPDLNPYNYAAANPTNLSDPTGLSPSVSFGLPVEPILPGNPASSNGNCGNSSSQEWQTADVVGLCGLISTPVTRVGAFCVYRCYNDNSVHMINAPLGGCDRGWGLPISR